MKKFIASIPIPILSIFGIITLPLFACYLALCVCGAAISVILEEEELLWHPTNSLNS